MRGDAPSTSSACCSAPRRTGRARSRTLVRRLGPVPRIATAPRTRCAPSGSPSSRSTCATSPRYDLVIDRLAYWYYHPREWLKKVALMDDVYLLNSPFTFQSMEKHAAYCAMMRLGLKVPETVAGAVQEPARQRALGVHGGASTTGRSTWTRSPSEVGYPLFMKPFDGGAWVGVSRITDAAELHAALRRVRASG